MSGERFRRFLRWTNELNMWARLLGATAGVAAMALILWLLEPVMAPHPYFLFMLVVAVSALLLDRLWGIYALVISIAIIIILFTAPFFSIYIGGRELVSLIVFGISCIALIFVTEMFRKLTNDLDEADRRKAMLMREMQHRVMNNLQVLSSTINLEAADATHEEAKKRLARVGRRVAGMARTARALHHSAHADRYDAREFLSDLVHEIAVSLAADRRIVINCHVDVVEIDRESAELFGLVVNELITNVVKHAFPDGQSGAMAVEFVRSPDNELRLTVSDNGVGCSSTGSRGSGLGLISALARVRGGSVQLEDAQPGCRVVVSLPSRPDSGRPRPPE